ncbi:HtrL protein [uncultured Caudovirales phage]|uniref:HtrL protein n=1 Tax=uncultured Caudovirales phage TaxID=2100421 RepID=A0A6J5L675_9CAUD|nr:HtrL protein [uncultured Caudovirales phage]
MSNITLVTGLWNIGRENLEEGWSRSFSHYLEKFEQLLKVEENLIIFGEKELEEFVWEKREQSNTQFILRDKSWFIENEFYDKIQKIRTNPEWYNQSGWLKESTQGRLEIYNPLVMSKMFLLNDARIFDKFDSQFLFWIDAGLTNTVHPGYFTHDKVLNNLSKHIDKFTFVCFPYDTNNEIHGFSYPSINNWANDDVKKVARGGLFGGPKKTISQINGEYYNLLNETLSQGYMGTEESIFSIMIYKFPEQINYFEIESNGLFGKFFEDLKNDELIKKSEYKIVEQETDINKVALYVITFNSPKQFKTLIDSMLRFDKNYINKTQKYLLDNSTDLSTTEEYIKICEEYEFEHIKKDNLGITGGRQWIAEHFEETGLDYMLFFEDDMFFYTTEQSVCRNGFLRYSDNFYYKTLEIIQKEKFDFLKLNFSEFYGDNSVQWSWYNVPQHFREQHWPKNKRLPQMGLDPNAPRTQFKEIKSHKGIPYASGEIFICNWPIILSKKGSYKCYLETKFQSPFEQTIMSHNFQQTIQGKLNPGILLMTPTEHDRFEHYSAELRKEC